MSKTDVKAHTDENVAGNQWSLIATETWQLNKLGTADVPSYTSRCFLSQQSRIPYEGLNNPTRQTISEYKLVSTSAWGASGAELCVGNGPLYTAQVILLPAQASLKSISCGIINSFRSIKGPVHTHGQTDRPKRFLFARCSRSFPERLERQRGNAPEMWRRRTISYSLFFHYISYRARCVFLHKKEDRLGEKASGIQPRSSPHQHSSFIFGDRNSFSSMTHLCKWLIIELITINVICWCPWSNSTVLTTNMQLKKR